MNETDPNNLAVENDTPPIEQQTIVAQNEGEKKEDTASTIDPEAPYGRKADGTPAKKRGRKPAGDAGIDPGVRARLESVTQAPPRRQQTQTIAPPPPQVVDYGALGRVAATLFFGTGELLLGEDWAPETGEPQTVANAFASYFKATDINDIPPGVALTLILGSYTLKRVTKPTIKQRISKGVVWLKSLIKR